MANLTTHSWPELCARSGAFQVKPTGTRLHSGGIRSSASGTSTVFKRYSCGTKVANLRPQPALLRKKLKNTGMLAISIRALAASTSGNRHVTNALTELKQTKKSYKWAFVRNEWPIYPVITIR